MTPEQQAQALAAWLDAPPGTPPPDGVDPEVLESVYALRPELAPGPRLTVDDLLDGLAVGPFATPSAAEPPRGASIGEPSPTAAPANRPWWWAAGAIAAVAAAALLVVPLVRQDEPAAPSGTALEFAASDAPSAAPRLREEEAPARRALAFDAEAPLAAAAPPIDDAVADADAADEGLLEPRALGGAPDSGRTPAGSGAAASADLDGFERAEDRAARPAPSLEKERKKDQDQATRGDVAMFEDVGAQPDPDGVADLGDTLEADAAEEEAEFAPSAPLPRASDTAKALELADDDLVVHDMKAPADLSRAESVTISSRAAGRARDARQERAPRREAPPSAAPAAEPAVGAGRAGVDAADETEASFDSRGLDADRAAAARAAKAGRHAEAATRLDPWIERAPPRLAQEVATEAARAWLAAGRPDLAVRVAERGLSRAAANDPERAALLAALADARSALEVEATTSEPASTPR